VVNLIETIIACCTIVDSPVFMPLQPFSKFLPQGFKADFTEVCGIDEVGRGCWAGPLVACALMFNEDIKIKDLKDSKQLTKEKREEVFEMLSQAKKEQKVFFGVGISEVHEVDDLGVIKANNLAFVRALKEMVKAGAAQNSGLKKFKASENIKKSQRKFSAPKFLLVDGRDKLLLPYPFATVIKGDEKIKMIACASIIAKVTRDRMMCELAKKYPEYGFELHKGYGTERHQQAINEHGITAIHRRHYKPVYMTFQATLPFGD
jgi:ribonuclease HII